MKNKAQLLLTQNVIKKYLIYNSLKQFIRIRKYTKYAYKKNRGKVVYFLFLVFIF